MGLGRDVQRTGMMDTSNAQQSSGNWNLENVPQNWPRQSDVQKLQYRHSRSFYARVISLVSGHRDRSMNFAKVGQHSPSTGSSIEVPAGFHTWFYSGLGEDRGPRA